MERQLSIFDIGSGKGKRKPCEYRWQRYIGQRVELVNGKQGRITKILPYDTYVAGDDGYEYAGTPTTMWPCKEEEGV